VAHPTQNTKGSAPALPLIFASKQIR
jgi:hypothetical protein